MAKEVQLVWKCVRLCDLETYLENWMTEIAESEDYSDEEKDGIDDVLTEMMSDLVKLRVS